MQGMFLAWSMSKTKRATYPRLSVQASITSLLAPRQTMKGLFMAKETASRQPTTGKKYGGQATNLPKVTRPATGNKGK